MPLTTEAMDEYAAVWEAEASAPDAPHEGVDGVIAVGAVLIDRGDLRVDPLELF